MIDRAKYRTIPNSLRDEKMSMTTRGKMEKATELNCALSDFCSSRMTSLNRGLHLLPAKPTSRYEISSALLSTFKVSLLGSVLFVAGCGGAPSVTIAGAYFPAWLFCAILAVVVAVVTRVLMVATGLARLLPLQLAVCISIGILVAVAVWKVWVKS
jgi:hypothetical protein